jgi:hypothetical protein
MKKGLLKGCRGPLSLAFEGKLGKTLASGSVVRAVSNTASDWLLACT